MGDRGGLAAAGDAQLAEDVRHVNAGRLRAYEQLGGDLRVRATLGEQLEHLALALGQAERIDAGLVAALELDARAASERADVLEQRGGADRLGQPRGLEQRGGRVLALAGRARVIGIAEER